MGIFSRLFQRGQDGNPADGPVGDQDDDTMNDAPSTAPEQGHSQGSAAAPAATPAEDTAPNGSSYIAPGAGLTPAFATPASSVAHASAEQQRSIWDWPGPQPRRGDRSAVPPSSSAPVAAETPSPAASEPRAPARGGGLPSVPRAQTAGESSRAAEPARDSGKEKDATMVLSPPPAPGSPPSRGSRPASAASPALPGLPPTTKPAPSAPAAPAPAPAPAAAPRTAAAAPPPAPAAPVAPSSRAAAPAGRPSRRAHSDSVGAAFDQVIESQPGDPAQPAHGVLTPQDLAEVRGVFNEVAAIHVAQVRDVMLELRYGDAQPAWIESTQPALRSLRAMAGQMELADLCQALDAFCIAVNAAVEGRARIDDDAKADLLRRYQRLIELIPQAFELDAERDRREPIIVEALLYQIPGVEKRTIEKLFAVGLSRLDALMRASSEELAVVAGLRAEIADAIVEQLRSYRSAAASALAAPDPLSERKHLGDLLIMMSVQNDDYNHAATMWTDEAKARKHEARKQREQVFQRVKVSLARLGERDLLARLDKLPFHERIATLDRYLSAAMPARPQSKST
jgi:hypothetical protein